MRKLFLTLALAAMTIMGTASLAFANHSNFNYSSSTLPGGQARYNYVNNKALGKLVQASGCEICHGGGGHGGYAGPHGNYTTSTKKCATCHVIHSNVADNGRIGKNDQLLPGTTVTEVCAYCHDLTGSKAAPYSTEGMVNDTSVKSAHRIAGYTADRGLAINVAGSVYDGKTVTGNGGDLHTYMALPATTVPGGDGADGGTIGISGLFAQGTMSNAAATKFTCDSCHTPHGLKTVKSYFGESMRKIAWNSDSSHNRLSPAGYMLGGSRLLKTQLTVGGATYNDYGSAWCAGCHQGRLAMTGSNQNHPVNVNGKGYDYGFVANKMVAGTKTPALTSMNGATPDMIDNGVPVNVGTGSANVVLAYGPGVIYKDAVTGDTSITQYLNEDPRSNAWYTMSDVDALNGNAPRADGYVAIGNYPKGPSCQQCHASYRDVDKAFGPAAAATPVSEETILGEGAPEAMSFPHISRSQYLLVEDNTDDLCTNCHGTNNLP